MFPITTDGPTGLGCGETDGPDIPEGPYGPVGSPIFAEIPESAGLPVRETNSTVAMRQVTITAVAITAVFFVFI